MPELTSFVGRWRLERHIEDRMTGHLGQLSGDAVFERRAGSLAYIETGVLRMGGGSPLRAQQRYFWLSDEGVVSVLFQDGRPFHTFGTASEKPKGRHVCGADLYDFSYDFTRWPEWAVTWTVHGPRKDYTTCSAYVGR